MIEQTKEYLNKFGITNKAQLERHITELSRNTYVNKDLVFMLVMFLDEEELFPNLLSPEIETTTLPTVESGNKKETVNRLIEEELEKQERDAQNQTECGAEADNQAVTFVRWIDILGRGVEKKDIPIHVSDEGIKENSGKLYYELSWEFIEEMAKRMANNKSEKYPPYNWKKTIDVEELKQAINRHHIEVMKGNYKDGDEIFGHIVSYACNSMMLWEQLKNNKK